MDWLRSAMSYLETVPGRLERREVGRREDIDNAIWSGPGLRGAIRSRHVFSSSGASPILDAAWRGSTR